MHSEQLTFESDGGCSSFSMSWVFRNSKSCAIVLGLSTCGKCMDLSMRACIFRMSFRMFGPKHMRKLKAVNFAAWASSLSQRTSIYLTLDSMQGRVCCVRLLRTGSHRCKKFSTFDFVSMSASMSASKRKLQKRNRSVRFLTCHNFCSRNSVGSAKSLCTSVCLEISICIISRFPPHCLGTCLCVRQALSKITITWNAKMVEEYSAYTPIGKKTSSSLQSMLTFEDFCRSHRTRI